MFQYYVNLALGSLRRDRTFTTLMVVAMGVGIGASMTMLTILRAASSNPIPSKATQLFVPQIENFGPAYKWRGDPDNLPPLLTYLDVAAWMKAHVGIRQTALYPTLLSINVPESIRTPTQVFARAAYSDFFAMFEVPFEYGAAWSRNDDDHHSPVVVLARGLNDSLFAGRNSIGKTLTIGEKTYRIVGVADRWHPSPRFYDPGFQSYSGEDQLFLPFARAIDEQMPTYATLNCDGAGSGHGWQGLLNSNCIWMRFWVELPTVRDVAVYGRFLQNYAAQQQRVGRFHWPAHAELKDVPQWLSYSRVVPPAVRTLTGVSFALLLVCVLNAVGLMLAGVMARAGSVGVRRALGATRLEILIQFMVEAGVIGVTGGVVGLAFTQLGLACCRGVLDRDLFSLAHLHKGDVVIALSVAVLATLLAAVYPTWRAMQVSPALQLKRL